MSPRRAAGAAPPAVVLVRPQEEGNVGAVARAMANMGLERLLLVEPAVPLGSMARALAVKARGILAGAERFPSLAEAVRPFQRVVGTTASRGRRLPMAPLAPRELGAAIAAEPEVGTALVFGPETSGLTLEELALCGAVVGVPAAARHPTLNLAQAVLIVAYELFLARRPRATGESTERPAPPEAPARAEQVEGLFRQLEPLLAAIGFARDESFAGVLRDLRRLAARSELTEREVAILRGICRRAGVRLAHQPKSGAG